MVDLHSILRSSVEAGHAPGLVAAVITPGGARLEACAGARGVTDPTPMSPDTLFWIASCSKAITSVAALRLVEQGLLGLDEPVGARLPALATPRVLTGFDSAGAPVTSPAKAPITLRRLLSHTSGLAYDFNSAALGRYLEATGGTLMGGGEPDIPLMFEPGEAWLYGIGIDWAGRLIEAAAGKPLDEVVGELVLKPLGMGDTTYFPNASEAARKAGVQQKLDDGTLLASAFGLPPVRHFMMGGGGLYSTAPDYLKFLAMILQRGAPLLRRETFDEMMRDQTGGLDAGSLTTAQPALSRDFTPLPGLTRRHGLAGLVNIDPVPGGRSAHSLTWAGLANCYYWADPDAGAAGVVMAQVLPFADPALLETFAAVERAVYA